MKSSLKKSQDWYLHNSDWSGYWQEQCVVQVKGRNTQETTGHGGIRTFKQSVPPRATDTDTPTVGTKHRAAHHYVIPWLISPCSPWIRIMIRSPIVRSLKKREIFKSDAEPYTLSRAPKALRMKSGLHGMQLDIPGGRGGNNIKPRKYKLLAVNPIPEKCCFQST